MDPRICVKIIRLLMSFNDYISSEEWLWWADIYFSERCFGEYTCSEIVDVVFVHSETHQYLMHTLALPCTSTLQSGVLSRTHIANLYWRGEINQDVFPSLCLRWWVQGWNVGPDVVCWVFRRAKLSQEDQTIFILRHYKDSFNVVHNSSQKYIRASYTCSRWSVFINPLSNAEGLQNTWRKFPSTKWSWCFKH